MAKRKINKAQAIRDTLQSLGPDTRPKDVMAHLAEKRIKVSAAQISNIKSSLRGEANGDSKNGLTVDALMKAKAMADRMGGVEKARKALDALATLR